ncbi:MAG: ribosome silencing factor [Gammaproteobacteria bacterium]|uniref:ribosome silencing factor n=1 Tax=Rhodoferax sp. TaxID=50421 RepID=UPI001791C63E|nr:ribosome silencing factor [Rhodoferax sp.]MBU3899116.1 ribosome silencing factor [Gammaproteobacteria bacterium]MBA3057395.1 ribosome silencing factor [Rhodoferax sp.]MBU3997676.1 ribosome silencing factor [Gammaproteobacteria bacterium]MBU4018560.1 ribosome silencing factor [Gammaproteobacteria bacterium]MBU4080572.1 ribosome silencing factor [Gammaproteobacteria bacterium]
MTTTTSPTIAKKDIQKLQRAIVDGLEDVKAQDIVVFDTEHLSALFERVIIASGTSNRQTKALAASVRDAVRDADFPKPRMEGETNGEWIIVDCGQAVVHIMQPNFRQYYNLEELWGDKPVRLKFGAVKPAVKEAAKPIKEVKAVKAAAQPIADIRRSNAAKKGVAEAFPSKAQLQKAALAAKAPAKKAAAKRALAKAGAPVAEPKVAPKAAPKVAAKTTVKAVPKVAVKRVIVNDPAKKSAPKKVLTKAAVAKKTPAKKAPAKKTAVRKA